MPAKTLMIQGTASSVGKSLVTAALCRIFSRRGLRVAPFKAQNMALNSFVTADGHEMGRAQAMQAEAARIVPDVRMNPILLKPTSDKKSQIIVNGKARSVMSATEYYEFRPKLREDVRQAFESLAAEYDLIIIEGAGSPAEINLSENDLVNMGMAEMANSPVLLVGDIDRGGVFASLYGTVRLLQPAEQARIAGFIINKFRGDGAILEPGLRQLEYIMGLPVLGVLPHTPLHIDDEDSLSPRFDAAHNQPTSDKNTLDIVVIRLPRLSNATDFAVFDTLPDIRLRYIERVQDLGKPDLVILPGSKNTMDDLLFLKQSGFAFAIRCLQREGCCIAGICGGFQMMGHTVHDPHGAESTTPRMTGLGLLDIETWFAPEKHTKQATANVQSALGFLKGTGSCTLSGYEIHMGHSTFGTDALPFLQLLEVGRPVNYTAQREGAINADGTVFGTYLHGIFDCLEFTRTLCDNLRRARGITPAGNGSVFDYAAFKNAEYTRLADMVEAHMNMEAVCRIVGVKE